eukprot:CAMPEP_0116151778 /NCGR_PEP_ID=MMETSP0329-20121206/20285_1 /TAXON_ID=697910 /ORGANISM="Pseudo-nitzschia arenysensis, Strain B593" /LENGTH=1492 /DNA_ID=CAMNT_0003648427 /DNA_START=178 /DNA_END=4656 /DNA_ORIENTATION=+
MDCSNPVDTKIISSSTSNSQETKTLVSSHSSTPQKRPRQVDDDDEGGNNGRDTKKTTTDRNSLKHSDQKPTKMSYTNDGDENDEKLVVRGLRLEAIFHPKFDNERKKKGSSGDVRSTMLQKLGIGEVSTEAGKGHLEVSLKHSGSLVLWSGSTRYYSKNSACNEFTRMTEILLRQRFETVRQAMASAGLVNDSKNNPHSYRSYEDCSSFVSRNRYTVAFEVVTAEMLGDHGQAPNLDYVVVTAVADREHERFLSTTQVLEFCHRFRLPHNDVWTFFPPPTTNKTETSSAELLFQIYDNSLRESGYTENTVEELTKIADVYIPSPIPHSVFQGSICEGFIVRYVDDDSSDPAEMREQLEGLAKAAQTILKEVPPPSSPSLESTISEPFHSDSVLDTDMRALYQSISHQAENENVQSQEPQKTSSTTALRRRAELFSESLKMVLQDGTDSENDMIVDTKVLNENEPLMKRPRRRQQRQDLKRIEKEQKNNDGKVKASDVENESKTSLTNYHLPALTKDLVESKDNETKRIATLLQALDELKGGGVKYIWMEKQDCHNPQRKRLYCVIHVCNDSTFFKFQSLQSPSDMNLFRGFCVEVLLSSPDKEEDHVDWNDEDERFSSVVEEDQLWKPQSAQRDGVSGAPLMLKMKLLPYMVRTFICRNLLNTIYQKGPEEFERIALNLLEKWKMSSAAQERWMPFFGGWAMYVLQCKAEQEVNEVQIRSKAGDLRENKYSLLKLGPLTNFSYLRHLEHFTKLYESGQFRSVSSSEASTSPEFQTFVCFVSQSTEVSSALASYFAKTHYFVDSNMKVCSLGEAAKNHRSKSCIVYANVGDLTKGIKKFICDKKVAKRSILILFGSNKDEIIAQTSSTADEPPEESSQKSWIDIPSVGEGKRLVSQWKSWKKFPCAKRFELSRSFVQLEPKMDNSNTATITSMNDTQDIVEAIQGVGTALMEQDKKTQSDPSRGGILVFFPGIPGCGKSTLLESSQSKIEEKMGSLKKDAGDLYDRNVHVKEGDKVGKNFWNIIEDLLSDDNSSDGKSPALVIADKNAPPASWQKLGQISNESNAIMLPVLPDTTGLETTTIEGSILPDGTVLPHASHFYPFSLKFLAVSLSRVLNRPAGKHVGKLDSGFPMACMVVVQFFSFYRYIGADTFQEKMSEKFDKDGAFSIKFLQPIQLPFLTAAAQDQALPDDLKDLLVEALQLRHGHDKNKKFKVKKDDSQMIDLENRLRSSIEKHKEAILAMAVNLEDSMQAFAVQMTDRIQSLSIKAEKIVAPPTNNDSIHDDDASKNVKLVSLDIDRFEIQELLNKHKESGALKDFYDFIPSFSSKAKNNNNDSDTTMANANEIAEDDEDDNPDPNFVKSTHVTMAFAGEKNPPETLLANFRHLQGRPVSISVTGFLWSTTNAAFAIKIASCTADKESFFVPPCENSFAHITVWVAPDVKKSLSNQLPNLVESGKASRVDFDQEDALVGTLCFWNHKNEPFVLLNSLSLPL